jgi:hypothetical protein
MLNDIIHDADGDLMDALGFINAIHLIASSLGEPARDQKIDDGFHSLQLLAEQAKVRVANARSRLEDAEYLPPVDKSNNGDN